MVLHMMACKRPTCSCGSYPYPHRPLSGLCTQNPDAQLLLASRAGTPDADLDDVWFTIVTSMPGKLARECPF
jgi:hypothetical protein